MVKHVKSPLKRKIHRGSLKYLICVPSLIVLEEWRPLTEIRRCQRCSSCPCVWRAVSFWGSVVCVCVLPREESLKWKTKREMWPSPLCRWQKRVWCLLEVSRSSKPVTGYKDPQTHEAQWLCVVVAGLCNAWMQILFDILCLSEMILLCFVPPFKSLTSQYDNLPPSGD